MRQSGKNSEELAGWLFTTANKKESMDFVMHARIIEAGLLHVLSSIAVCRGKESLYAITTFQTKFNLFTILLSRPFTSHLANLL